MSRQYFVKKVLKMLRLRVGSWRLSGSEFQVDRPPTANCPFDTADWRTADVDDWWHRLFVCNFPLCTSELFNEDIGTPARWAWILLGRRHRASGVYRAVVATSRSRTSGSC